MNFFCCFFRQDRPEGATSRSRSHLGAKGRGGHRQAIQRCQGCASVASWPSRSATIACSAAISEKRVKNKNIWCRMSILVCEL
jgi:hypothetical protein